MCKQQIIQECNWTDSSHQQIKCFRLPVCCFTKSSQIYHKEKSIKWNLDFSNHQFFKFFPSPQSNYPIFQKIRIPLCMNQIGECSVSFGETISRKSSIFNPSSGALLCSLTMILIIRCYVLNFFLSGWNSSRLD